MNSVQADRIRYARSFIQDAAEQLEITVGIGDPQFVDTDAVGILLAIDRLETALYLLKQGGK